MGADLRMLLGSSFTISATINPDFGQVEQDPAVVNLSAFESYFAEKRPFFVEGSGLLFFGGFECASCSNTSGMNVFYSRRIGRTPQGAVAGEYEYTDAPANTRLLAAAKLTGRTSNGWQVAVLDAVTAREQARVVTADGERSRVAVEPLTNYWVGRVRRTTREGRVTWGLMATSVVRRFGDGDGTLRTQLPAHAEALGADWSISSRDNVHRLIGTFVLSDVAGDSLAIGRVQRSSARYFQRPDRQHGSNGLFSDRYDPSLTSLRGFGGYLRASRDQGPWLWEAMANYRSPGFEVNDLAFLTRADYLFTAANVTRQWTRPRSWYRNLTWIGGAQQQHNFDGDRTDLQVHSWLGGQLRGYWNAELYANYRPAVLDDRTTRGSAVVRRPATWSVAPSLTTDERRPVVLALSPVASFSADGGWSRTLNFAVRLKPASNVAVSASPTYARLRTMAQYVRQFQDPSATAFFGRRTLFAELGQTTVSMGTRVAWTFSPALTLELYAEPFVSAGRYTGFKEYQAPRSGARSSFDTAQIRIIERHDQGWPLRYRLDPDRDPSTADFEFDAPDFRITSLRGNAVLRWEFRPGSTLFLVWQQDRDGSGGDATFDLARDAGDIFRRRADNVFVMKATYWLGR
jgi:hypothetical protein